MLHVKRFRGVGVGLLVTAVLASLVAHGPAGADEVVDDLTMRPRVGAAKPDRSVVGADRDPGHVVLKFAEGTGVRLRDGSFTSSKLDVSRVNDIVARYGAQPTPAFEQGEQTLEELRAHAEERSRRRQADLNLYFYLARPARAAFDGRDASRTEQLLDELNAQGVVEIAYAASLLEEPGHQNPTPDYSGSQGYTDPAPGGVDSDYANTQPGGNGAGVRIVDIERGWNFTHEDLGLACWGCKPLISGVNRPASRDHGTAVMGEMVGKADGKGVTGMVPGAVAKASSACRTFDGTGVDCGTYSVSAALVDATSHLLAKPEKGKVILIEQQTSAKYPVEINQAEYDAIVTAVSSGITVVEAAANGGWNLDDYQSGGQYILRRQVRDSGAIMVGGGCAPTGNCSDRAALWFTNYGSRVDIQGWGHNVTTTGYGDLFGIDASADNPNRYYTSAFNGTSSASPIVTGAVAALQGISIAKYGDPVSPYAVRSILTKTGTPQPSADAAVKPIGPRPNLAQAVVELQWTWLLWKLKDMTFVAIGPDFEWGCLTCPPFDRRGVELPDRVELPRDVELPGPGSFAPPETSSSKGV